MQTSVLPVTITDRIDAIIRNFIWGGSLTKSKVHFLAWDRICRPKDQGGLGLRKARELNQAYLMKLGWTILNSPDKLWVQVMTNKYLKDTSEGLQLRRKTGGSALWRGIRAVWHDLRGACQQLLSVSEARGDDGNWDWELLRRFLPPRIIGLVAGMEPPSDNLGEDGIIWGPDPRGKFTLKSAYDILDSIGHHTDQDIWRIVWRWTGPSRLARDVELALKTPSTSSEIAWLKAGLQHKDFGLTFGIIIWILWKARNEAIFEDKLVTCDQLRLRVLYWIAGVRETMKADSQVASRGAPRRVEAHIGWKAGPQDCITINTDGSVLSPQSQAAAGGILRNNVGQPIHTFAAKLGRCSIMGFRRIHLQLDSQAAISAIRGGQDEDSRHSRTLNSINELLCRAWDVTISHTFREGNTVADLLAHHGHSLDFGLHID
ncbi:Putative ribonuclease H protein At1g65750, partial [Linum perenne]